MTSAAETTDANERGESQASADSAPDLAIVGIGASAGGLRALEEFFENMPADSGAAFVVIQHLSPDFKSLMNELLERRTQMSVRLVTEDMRLEANVIFLIPPGQNLVLTGQHLHLSQQDRGAGHLPNFPIDLFFESLATAGGDRTISIVLSGTGSDGTRGIKRVSEMGGIVLVQDPATAEFDGMPRSAIATHLVDLILPPQALAATTYQFVTSPAQRQALRQQQQSQLNPMQLRQIVGLLKRHENIDFTHYKPNTLTRRINRRCLIAGYSQLDSYIEHLEASAEERDLLRSDLLITVTSFFRDAEAWEILARDVLPLLIQQADPEKGLRIWITACATGEEAYSMAILLKELLAEAQSPIEAKIFATDVDQIALAKASSGVYSAAAVSDLSPERLKRFFKGEDDRFEVVRSLREMIIFANHNLTKDAGFTQMDLVTCRNALIYMQPDLQQQVLRVLHFSLKPHRILFLGESENLGALAEEFKPLSSKSNLYQKLRDVRLPFIDLDLEALSSPQLRLPAQPRVPEKTRFDPVLETAFQALLKARKATCFLVNRDNQLIHLCGDPLRLLTISAGPASQDVLRMLPESLRLSLSTALHQARQTGTQVRYSHCPIEDDTIDISTVRLEVSLHVSRSVGKFLMVLIEPEDAMPVASVPTRFAADEAATQYVSQLQQELQATRENLQATIEELETTNEDQQATNEELQSTNEELQSTNEELHSVNEELHMVNYEHQAKIQELIELNNDIDNLLNIIDIGVIYLDGQFKIRKFTRAATLAFNLVNADIGRPLEHLSHNLEAFDITTSLARTQQQQKPIAYDVTIKRGGRIC